MLLESGDLIPVLPEAVDIPWTRRKAQIMNFLHRGAVNFKTLVYDSNVGDIAPLSTYFNPNKWTVLDLNQKFGQVADSVTDKAAIDTLALPQGGDVKSASLTPKLILYPELAKHSRPASFGDSSRPRKLPSLTSRDAKRPAISVWSVPPPALTVSPTLDSNLPTPPSKSPGHEDPRKSSSGDENPDPIGPPKRRRMSALDEPLPQRLSAFNFGSRLTTRPASTSSPWTPLCSSEALSPFINFDSTWCQFDQIMKDVTCTDDFLSFDNNIDATFDEIIPADNSEAIRDEQALVRSLRKIAKAFETEEW